MPNNFNMRNPFLILCSLIAVFAVDAFTGMQAFEIFALRPTELSSIWKVFTAPMLHGTYQHLVNNLSLLFPLIIILYKYFWNHASSLLLNFWVWPSVIVWFIASPGTYVLGSSGVGFAVLTFLVSIGFILPRGKLFYMSLILSMFYGSVLFNWGFGVPGISWEYHTAGTFIGLLFAFIYAPLRIKNRKV